MRRRDLFRLFLRFVLLLEVLFAESAPVMKVFELLKRLLSRPCRRDVSRLASASEDADLVYETVETSDAPLKDHHLRRAVRDVRLLPKRRGKLPAWPRRRRPKLFAADEAARLFAATMRTRDRRIRDLAADEEQLRRYGLPLWHTESDVAAALELTLGELRHYALHRERERVRHYVTFSVPKRSGGRRLIMAPKRRLKRVQRRLLALLAPGLPVSEHAHGFRRGRSVKTNAAPHVGKAVVVKMDLEDFFPTVTFARVRGLLVALGYGYPVATCLAVLMTECERQPVDIEGELYHVPVGPRRCVQGAPTSPALCNAIVRRMDSRLAGLARRLGFTYTRYADDLTFSGDDLGALKALTYLARRIVKDEGFRLQRAKTRIHRRGGRQEVTGVVVNDVLGLSRKKRRRLRAALHRLRRGEPGDAPEKIPSAELAGHLAYLRMLNPGQAERL